MADFLDIDKRVTNAVNLVDDMANRRIRQISDMLDEKIDEIRELLNGIKVNVNIEVHEVRKPDVFNPPPPG